MTAGILPLLLALGNEAPPETIRTSFANFSAEYLYGDANAQIRDTNSFLTEYDFVVIGAGSGGCVMANRLSENPEWRVLLLEAGQEENMLLSIPLTAAAFLRETGYNWLYEAEVEDTICVGEPGGVCGMVKGRGLGGTSLHNYMVYTRGHYRDYDRWAQAGNYGWSYREVLPYFLKGERSYLKRMRLQEQSSLLRSFVEAGKGLEYRAIEPDDKVQLGFYKVMDTNTYNGQRYSAGRNYIHPVRNRPNLFISMNSLVTKILIDPKTKSAYGVEFTKNCVQYSVNVSKEVILSAGVIKSPQLLMLSGIGPKRHLESLSIPVIQSLNVGYNLHDHYPYSSIRFNLNRSVDLNPAEFTSSTIEEYLTHGTGVFSIPAGFEGAAFLSTPISDLPADYPDSELFLNSVTLNRNSPDIPLQLLGLPQALEDSTLPADPDRGHFDIYYTLEQPKSRGRISLRDSNPLSKPRIKTGYFSHPHDLETLIATIKISIEVGELRHFVKYGAMLDSTPVVGCESLPFGSDAYWRCAVRQSGTLCAHQCGTCKMGPVGDPTAVVNPELQVHGVRNLRVVDASIMPTPMTGHPNAAIYMIGEKAANMVKSHWLKG